MRLKRFVITLRALKIGGNPQYLLLRKSILLQIFHIVQTTSDQRGEFNK